MPPLKPARPKYDPIHAGCLCTHCPLRGKPVVPPKGPPDADFVIVGESPGYNEEQRGEPFIGASGVELDAILYRNGVKRSRAWLTNSILCRPEVPDLKGTKRYDLPTYLAWVRKQNIVKRKSALVGWKKGTPMPHFEQTPSPIDCCAPRLWSELAYFENVARARGEPNGIVVIPTGNYAAEAVVGRAGIMKLRGSPFVIDIADPRGHLHKEPGEP